jgi:shikimate dehydrogenase
MHNAAFKALGIDCVYLAFKVKVEDLGGAVNGIRSLGMLGVNVTMPHKVAISYMLDSLDPMAEMIGAVNTVHNVGGRLIGYNTDGSAALSVLEKHVSGLDGKKVLLLGAGGAARAIAFNLAGRCASLIILNRTEAKAIELAGAVKRRTGFAPVGARLAPRQLKDAVGMSDLLINATCVGMYPNVNDSPVERSLLSKHLTVFDVVYNPIETRLLRDAKSVGAKTISGVDMFVEQGAQSFKIWTGVDAPIEVMKKVVVDELKKF